MSYNYDELLRRVAHARSESFMNLRRAIIGSADKSVIETYKEHIRQWDEIKKIIREHKNIKEN